MNAGQDISRSQVHEEDLLINCDLFYHEYHEFTFAGSTCCASVKGSHQLFTVLCCLHFHVVPWSHACTAPILLVCTTLGHQLYIQSMGLQNKFKME